MPTLPTLQWTPALQVSLVALVIPAAILMGQRARVGPVVATGSGALVAFLMFWSLLTTEEFSGGDSFPYLTRYYILFSAVFLLLGAWALALAKAVDERRWAWVALLSLAVYLTFTALFVMWQLPYSICLDMPQQPYCAVASQGTQALLMAGAFIGPIVMLIYGLCAGIPQRGALPAGLRASHIGAPDVADTDTEPGSL
ncbi:MAG TPA: hypothetical protein VFQ25_10815 [Ktedonobacterales bacterium]|nr:hypothetical protein [Ktedonobacterales bacterium]